MPYEPRTVYSEAAPNSPESALYYVRGLQATDRAGSWPHCGRLSDRVALILWARQNEKIVSASFIKDLLELEEIRYRFAGNEHTVYHQPALRRALKITHVKFLARIGVVSRYLGRLAASIRVFADDVEIVGVLHRETQLQILTSQRWIFDDEGSPPITLVEIDSYFERLGFHQFRDGDGQPVYYDPQSGLIVADAHSQNFIRSDGELIPIDVKLESFTSELLTIAKSHSWGRRLTWENCLWSLDPDAKPGQV